MDATRRSALGGGIVLVLVGLAFLVAQLFPGVWSWVGESSWPLIVIGVGVLLLIIGLLTWVPGMMVPACIVGGIGGLLYWQNATGDWGSWAYAWALIPCFVGVGTILMGLLERKGRTMMEGAWTILIGLILFVIFGSFLGGPVSLGKYWPILLIVLGLISLGRVFLRPRK